MNLFIRNTFILSFQGSFTLIKRNKSRSDRTHGVNLTCFQWMHGLGYNLRLSTKDGDSLMSLAERHTHPSLWVKERLISVETVIWGFAASLLSMKPRLAQILLRSRSVNIIGLFFLIVVKSWLSNSYDYANM